MSNLSQAQRDKLPDSAFCGYGRTFPVIDREDIHKAVDSLGRAGSDQERADIKACVIRKAKMMKATDALPQNWQDQMGMKGN
jgi:hypothetical protein